LNAQTIPPPYINYQKVLYDVNSTNPNTPLTNQSFTTFVNINDELGNLLYLEEHYASTDANGLITIKMGDGIYIAGTIINFNQINWGVGKYYLVVDFVINGTTSSTAPEQLVTVPYSFYSGKSGNGMTAVADNGNGTLTFTYANGATYTTPTLAGITGAQGPIGPAGAAGIQGPPGIQGPQGAIGLLSDGSAAGNTPYWNGTQWVVNGSNFYNNGSNLGVGTSVPNSSAITEMNSTTQGFLPPRMTSTERDAIQNPANGLIIFNSTSGCPNYYSNNQWFEWCGTGVSPSAAISALNCGSTSITGTLTSGTAASGVSASVPYTGGNSSSYTAQTISSTGVTGLTATLTSGILANGAGSLSLAISGTPATSGTASFALTIGGQSCTLVIPVASVAASLTTLNCASGATTGTLTSNTAASGVSTTIPYTGGNGGTYSTQAVSSNGVLGLTANLVGGTLAVGAGNLVYTISGTPTSSGTASFTLTIGGQSCSFTVSVQSALAAQYPANSVFCASGPTAIVDVTNPTTGKIWMNRNLGASQAATSSTNAAAYGDLYQWGRRSDGHQCRTSATTSTLSSINQPSHGDFILTTSPISNWLSSSNTNLWQGVNGENNPCPNGYRIPTEAELNNERLSWGGNYNISGAFASPLKLSLAGKRNDQNGALINVGTYCYLWSSTVTGADNSRMMYVNITNSLIGNYSHSDGQTIRCIKDASVIPAAVGTLNCGSTSVSGTLTNGIASIGVSAEFTYTGGNGGSYATQSISSTSVTGLTATLTTGTLAFGSGTLSFAISGTPSASGTASFALTLGGQSCNFNTIVYGPQPAYPIGSVFCASGATLVNDAINPTTGKTWMDRNLGASQAATSVNNSAAYGDLYQWGRLADGHQCRNSGLIAAVSPTDIPGHGLFCQVGGDWRSTTNNNLWQGATGINNPCPSGYRLPTETELNAERLLWPTNNAAGAYNSILKLTTAGYRDQQNASNISVDGYGYYWTSSINSSNARQLIMGTAINDASMVSYPRGRGYSVRCIKN
jgi:uncharacterized protein (TIGR02145 family)